jgi:hypothetical protein
MYYAWVIVLKMNLHSLPEFIIEQTQHKYNFYLIIRRWFKTMRRRRLGL